MHRKKPPPPPLSLFFIPVSPIQRHHLIMSSDPLDVVQQYIEKNKEALSQISFGGGEIYRKSTLLVSHSLTIVAFSKGFLK
jgi:hypothetical protein